MVQKSALKQYLEALPASTTLKKKVIKAIMKSEQPLSQSELKDLLGQKDWTNLRRVLKELFDEGVVEKRRIGVIDYYTKVGVNTSLGMVEYGDFFWFVDMFEPDIVGGERYVRVKQTLRTGRDAYEVQGKITLPLKALQGVIEKLQNAQ